MASARKIRRESKRVRVLRRSNGHFRQARHLVRNALPRGKKRSCYQVDQRKRKLCQQLKELDRKATRALVDVLNEEALSLLPKDSRALVLARDIRNAANSGSGVAVRTR